MVHSLIPMSVDIKVKKFEEPARLINCMELTAALGMACRQAGEELMMAQAGMVLKEYRDLVLEKIGDNPRVDEKLLSVIRNYIFKSGETVDEDSLVILKLGYEFS